MHKPPAEQPPPTPNAGEPIWEMVREDMRQRDHVGLKRYRTRLQAHNGRDALRDAYEEALDLCVYLRQEIEERLDLRKEIARLEAILDAPQTVFFTDGRAPTENERHLLNLLSWRKSEIARLKADLLEVGRTITAQSEALRGRAEKEGTQS